MHPKIDEFFGKVTSAKFKLNLGGPAGGSALERASPPIRKYHMTRRAFLALRVIQRQGEFRSRRLVKKWCKWIRKMKIFQKDEGIRFERLLGTN